MATGRGWILQQHSLGASRPAILPSGGLGRAGATAASRTLSSRRPPFASPARESLGRPGCPAWGSTVSKCATVTAMQPSELKTMHIQKQHRKPFIKSISTTGIERPWRRSLMSEYQLANLTHKAELIGYDGLVELYHIEQGVLLGLWNKNEIAFVMACLHYHQLIERSILGSPTAMHTVAPDKAMLDDIDPEYGLHDYQLHIDMHSKGNTYMCGTFRSLFCRKDYIRNGYLRLTVISYKNNSQHLPLVGKLGLSWKTDALEGIVQNCFIMDVTLLDESQKPFWCFSAPVKMVTTSKAPDLYKYFGPSYYLNYVDSIGKVHVEMVWMEETQEYYITNLVLYLSTQKISSWFGRNY